MRFQYDPVKAAANVRKHGVWFADAEGVFEDPLALLMEDPDVLASAGTLQSAWGTWASCLWLSTRSVRKITA